MLDAMMPKKGSVSPLEGELGPEIMLVAKVCFMSMGLGACLGLTQGIGMGLEQAPLGLDQLTNIGNALQNAPKAPGIGAPSFPTPKMGGGIFG